MKYVVYTREGLDYGTPYGKYNSMDKAEAAALWLEQLGNVTIIKEEQ